MQNTASTKRLTAIETATCNCGSPSPAVMSVPDAATVLGLSKPYLYGGIRKGLLPGVRAGRARALPASFIRGFVAEVIELGASMSLEDYAAMWLENARAAA